MTSENNLLVENVFLKAEVYDLRRELLHSRRKAEALYTAADTVLGMLDNNKVPRTEAEAQLEKAVADYAETIHTGSKNAK